MSRTSFALFTDPRYHTEASVEIDTSQVVSVEEKTVKLFMAGKHRVTEIKLRNGETHLLRGHLATQLSATQPKLQ